MGGEFDDLDELERMHEEEESKAPAKVIQPQRQAVKQAPLQTVNAKKVEPDQTFDAEMKTVSAAAGGDDEIELEEKFHDPDIMECVSVIEHEIDYLSKVVKTIKDKDERDFYSDKIDSLKFKQSTIQSNIDNGFVTPDSYIRGVKAY